MGPIGMATSNQVRTVIELFCKILHDNNIADVRAETLRQAKFNKDSAVQPLWELLFHVICFCKNPLPSAGYKPTFLHFSKDEKVIYVKSELQKWGYLRRSLARLPHDMSSGSRELLMVVGWVVHTQKLLEKIITSRSSPLQQDLIQFVGLERLSEGIERFPALSDKRNNSTLRDSIQRQLMLCGKLRLSFRRLYMVHQQLAGLKNVISRSTEGVSLRQDHNHLTPLEVYLLRHPDSLKRMFAELERDNEQLKDLLDWREKENVFWEWLDSVLILHEQERSGQTTPESPYSVEEVYLPVPQNIGEDITAIRARLRDFILQHEADIEKLEELVLRKKVSRVGVEVLTDLVDREISQLAHRLQQCGRGWDPMQMNTNASTEGTTACLSESDAQGLMLSSLSQPNKSKSKYLMQSAQSIRADRQASIVEAAKREITDLDKQVQVLETELKKLETDNLLRLSNLTEKNTGMICIQPQYCKKLHHS